MLSAFFWGYTMTQFIGGYVSDHVGGEVVLFISASLWSVFTLFTPPVINISAVIYKSLSAVFALRMMLGLSQGEEGHKCLFAYMLTRLSVCV